MSTLDEIEAARPVPALADESAALAETREAAE